MVRSAWGRVLGGDGDVEDKEENVEDEEEEEEEGHTRLIKMGRVEGRSRRNTRRRISTRKRRREGRGLEDENGRWKSSRKRKRIKEG